MGSYFKKHRTVVGSVFYTKLQNNKISFSLPKEQHKFLWTEEGMCPDCSLSKLKNKFLITSCNTCGQRHLGLER